MKKGFTLVELLAVLVILSIVLGLVSINAIRYYNIRKQQDYENIKALIVDNAKVLVNSTSKKITKTIDSNLQTSNACRLNYSDLVNYNLMDKDTKNPTTGEIINDTYIKITVSDTYDYNYEYVDNDNESLVNCLNGL